MDLARIHEGIRRKRFSDVLDRTNRSELSVVEAAELLGISERTFRRWRVRHQDEGASGLSDRRLAPSPRRAPVAEIERMLGFYRDIYRGFTSIFVSGRSTSWAIRSRSRICTGRAL